MIVRIRPKFAKVFFYKINGLDHEVTITTYIITVPRLWNTLPEETTSLSRWRHSVSISRHGSWDNRIQISSSDLSFTDCL